MNPTNSDDVTDKYIIQEGLEIICRKKLDESRGNPWVCQCFLCRREREELRRKIR